MGRGGNFIAIFEGQYGKYYSAQELGMGKISNRDKTEITNLVYDANTKIIYYAIYNQEKIIFIQPYLSENGKYCRFVENNFEEVN